MTLPAVSVVVPTYNRAHQLPEVLAPLLADPAASEVIVVVDGSSDDSLAVLAGLDDAERLVVVSQANAGEGAARANGLARATGAVVLFLDDDVVAGPGLVAGHAAHHADGADRVVLGYMPPAPADPRDPIGFSIRLYAEAYEARCRAYDAAPEAILRNLWAGNMSLPAALARRVGLTNPAYTERYHPDREFGLRLLRAGAEATFDRALAATHHYERSVDAFLRDARSQGAGSTLLQRLHPEVAGELPRDRFETATAAPVAGLIRLGRRPRAARLMGWTGRAVLRTARPPALAPVQMTAARFVRRVEQQRGAIDAFAGRR